ncbi:MAG: hypothetical protein KGL74_00975 [Elusimicrobia bacterium]|nr:hypothetical protein [Elusimicrobiota bacterium]
MTAMTRNWTPPANFEDWLSHVFDRPVSQPEWFRATTDEASWEPRADSFLAYLAKTFEQPEAAFGRFTDAQVRQGLNFLINPSCSNAIFALKDAKFSWTKRERVVRAIPSLFKYFAKRCSPALAHLDEKGANPLNSICYMWWDVIPLYGDTKNAEQKNIDLEALAAMKSTLEVNHAVCQESALHGLGHWLFEYRDQVEKIIDEFLACNDKLRPELKHYALNARAGKVQ